MFKRLLLLFLAKFNNIKIKNKIFIIMVIFIIFSTSFVGYFLYIKVSEIIIHNSFIQTGETIGQTSKYINEKLTFTLNQFCSLELDEDFLRISQNRNSETDVMDFIEMDSKFEQIRVQNSSLVENIFFYRYDGKPFYEFTSMLNRKIEYAATDWYQAVVKNNYYVLWYKSRDEDIFFNPMGIKVFGIMKEVNDKNFRAHGILVFDLKEKFLRDILKNLDLGKGSVVFITDSQQNVISSSLDATNADFYKGHITSVMEAGKDKGNFKTLGDKESESLVVYDTIPVNKWKIIVVIPSASLTEGARIVKSITFYIVLISISLSAAFALFIVRMITSPIIKLATLMKRVQTGDLQVSFHSKYNDEIGLLGRAFNNMIDGIKALMVEVKEEKQKKVEAELRALQAQINPHFLYNTLDSIYWMSKNGNRDNAAEMAAALANLFRLGLNKGYDMTTVEKEAEHIKNYLVIEKLRYEEKFEYSIDIDSAIYHYRTLKLILQPLAENAILHGIYEKDGAGFIRVRGRKEGHKIIFEVIDNGIGMNVEKVKTDIKEHIAKQSDDGAAGYALSNVYGRIKMRYRDEGEMEFFSVPNVETRVVISIPAEESCPACI